MAGFFQNFLNEAGSGFVGNDYLRDYQHASKTFRSNAYGYAPKFKYLFHVYFDINETFINQSNNWPKDHNFGLTVKSVQLPKFTMDLHTMNQYNRKRIVQTKIKYDPVNLVLHDDNSNLMTKLWHAYYTYYYKDGAQKDPYANSKSTSTNGDLNKRNIYDKSIAGNDDWGYVGEAASGSIKVPFFRAINIYGFNQHNFTLYRLINPMIESFAHDSYDYAAGNGVMEHQMSIQYETVKYYEGAVDGRRPDEVVKMFGSGDHYDNTISPIATPGSNSTIIGQGGLLDAAGGILDDIDNQNYLHAIRTAAITAKTFNNPKAVAQAAKNDVLGAVSDSLRGTPNRNTFNFPTGSSSVVQRTADSINGAIAGLRKNP